MRRSITSVGVVLAGLVGLSAQGFSQEAPKFGLQYRADIIHDDHGITKADGADAPSKTTNLSLEAANLTVGGTAAEKVTYDVNYSMKDNKLNWGFIKAPLHDAVTLEVGRDYTNQGGWDNYNWLYDTILVSPYTAANLPIGDGDVVELQFTTIGLNLQFVNDNDPVGGKQPAYTLEYMKAYGAVTPLFQYGIYDFTRSSFMAVGVAYNANAVDLYFDYIVDSRSQDATDKDAEKDVYTNMVLDVAYTTGNYKPFLKYAKMDVKQGGTDAKENTIPDGTTIPIPDTVDGWFNDNAAAYTVGVKYLGISKSFVPFAALISQSGKFTDTTRTNSQMRLGVMGTF
jgi:hypothetical protein